MATQSQDQQQDVDSLWDVLAALHALNVPDNFLSPSERARAQLPAQQRDLQLPTAACPQHDD